MEKALLFFDIDGTIIDSDGLIPASTVRALKAVQQTGALCFVNTGRPFGHIDRHIKKLGFDGYVCSCGQHIEFEGKTVLHEGFSIEESHEIAALNRRCGLDSLYESESGLWLDFNGPLPDTIRSDRNRFDSYGLSTHGSVTDPSFRFDKFCIFETDHSDLKTFLGFINDKCTVIDRGLKHFYECIRKGYSKQTGIFYVRSMLNISEENCYAFGDGPNDLPMLQSVLHSVAMAEAPDSVKAVCEYVTSGFYEDGIEKALLHYGLIH